MLFGFSVRTVMTGSVMSFTESLQGFQSRVCVGSNLSLDHRFTGLNFRTSHTKLNSVMVLDAFPRTFLDAYVAGRKDRT